MNRIDNENDDNSDYCDKSSKKNLSYTNQKSGKSKILGRPLLVFLSLSFGHILFGTYLYSTGYFYVELLEMYGETALKTSLVGTLNSSLLCFLAPFATIVMNRYTARVAIFSGGLLIATGCFLSAFVKNIIGLIVTFGIIAGAGNALAIIPSLVIAGFYFEKHHHFVLSAVPIFTGIGLLLSTPVGALYIKTFGLHGAYLTLSAQMLQICVVATVCKPSQAERDLIVSSRNKDKSVEDNNNSEDKNKDKENGQQRKPPLIISFVLFLIGTLAYNIVFGTYEFHYPNYLLKSTGSKRHTEAVMTLLGVGSTTGRIFSTLVLIKHSTFGIVVYIISLLVSGVVSLIYPFFEFFIPLHYMFGFIIGFTTGAPYGVMASIVLTIVGIKWLSTSFAVAFLFCGIGGLTGPIFSSYLLDTFGTYDSSFSFVGCGSLVGCLCAVLAAVIIRKKQNDGTLKR